MTGNIKWSRTAFLSGCREVFLGPQKKIRKKTKFDFFKKPTGLEQHRAMPGNPVSSGDEKTS